MLKKFSKNVQLVLDILKNEVDGDVSSALKKMSSDYTMTWVYQKSNEELFPSTTSDIESEIEEVYPIKGREYRIKNIAEGEHVVMVELIESYPDSKTKKVYRTPLVLVLEMRKGKIRTGRHYCDPKVSYLHLDKASIDRIYKNRDQEDIIIKN